MFALANRRQLRIVLLLLASCVTCGCAAWFPTETLTRPIAISTSIGPEDSAERIAKLFDTDVESVDRSLRRTESAARYYSIAGFAGFSAYLNIDRLGDALALTNQNAWAWVNLGPWLALNYRPNSAIDASFRGLQYLQEDAAANPAPEDRAFAPELYTVAELNLANYQITTGDFLSGLITLANSDASESLEPIFRLAHGWLSTMAFMGLEQYELARETLLHTDEASLSLAESIVRPSSYPQYFKERQLNYLYLHAALSRAEGDLTAAINQFEEILIEDPGSHQALFGMAGALAEAGDKDGAIRTLLRLEEELDFAWVCDPFPRNGQFPRRERVHFNLATLLAEAGDVNRAIDQFTQAIEIKHCTREGYNEDLQRVIARSEYDEFRDLLIASIEEEPTTFPEASNNRGLTYASLWRDGNVEEDERDGLFESARSDFLTAATDPTYESPQIAWANLAQLYLDAGPGYAEDAFQAARESLQVSPGNVRSQRLMFSVATLDGASDANLAVPAFNVLIDSVTRSGSTQDSEEVGLWVGTAYESYQRSQEDDPETVLLGLKLRDFSCAFEADLRGCISRQSEEYNARLLAFPDEPWALVRRAAALSYADPSDADMAEARAMLSAAIDAYGESPDEIASGQFSELTLTHALARELGVSSEHLRQ